MEVKKSDERDATDHTHIINRQVVVTTRIDGELADLGLQHNTLSKRVQARFSGSRLRSLGQAC